MVAGNFPEKPTGKQLRKLIGFRVFGLVAFGLFAAWRWWEGDVFAAGLVASLVVFFACVSVVPRVLQLRRLSRELRAQEHP